MARERQVIDQLFVLVKSPRDARHVIGHLSRSKDGFVFSYLDRVAEIEGFRPLVEFPDLQKTKSNPYRSRYLFPTFAERIPIPRRPDRAALLHAWGVENGDDDFEILARSGGKKLTDRIELAEYRADDDDLVTPLDFRLAGATQERFASAAARVCRGDELAVRRDQGNPFDRYATLVFKDEPIGFVPKPYTKLVAAHLEAGHLLKATAHRQLSIAPDTGRWVVRLVRVGTERSRAV